MKYVIGRSERSNIQGSVKLRLWLSTREDRGLSEEEDARNEVKQQQQIFTTLLLSHLENFKVHIFCSSGRFEADEDNNHFASLISH